MFGSNFRDFVSQDAALQDQSSSERLIKSWHGFEKPDSEDSGIEEEFEVLDSESQEIPAVPEDELGDFQCSSFGDDYEIIEVSDLNGMRIAGFSKQELLELCNFCKIGYGNNDKKLDSRYKTKAELINEGYGIIPFYYNERNIRCAGFVFTKDKEITIAYRGTQDFDDVITDVSTALTSEILPEGGKMHNGFCNAFYDSLPSLSKILDSYAKEQGSEIKDFKINCTGHSMGAALATITALYLKKVKDAEYVRVATFGSPRVFDFHGAEIYEKLLGENTIRVTNLSDPIPMFPSGSMGFKHVGESLKIKTGNLIVNCLVTDLHIVGKYYHKTDTYYGCIQNMKPEDFQPDSNRSRYYYFSYVVAVPYYIITTALTTPYYLFFSAISNTEQRYFEREMEFAGLISHKNGFNAMVGEDPLIMSHIECNFNGRGEVPLYINNNGNSMELRQLCGTENMSVRFLSSIGDNLVAGGSLAMRSTCSNSELSQQPQENIVDKRENIMNNEKASIEEAIGNDYRRGKMGKNSAKKRKERIKRSKEEKKKNEQEKEVQFRELYVGKNDGSKVITEVDSSKKKQAPGQLAGYVEQTGGLGSSNDNNPLDNGTNSEKNSTFKTDEQDTKPAPILEPVPSVANENSGQVNNVQSNGRQSDNQNNKDVQDVSTTTSDQVTPVSSDTENNKVEKSGVSLQSSGYVDNSTVLSFVDREHVIHVDAQVSWDVSCLVETISEDTDEVANNQNGVLLLEAQPMVQIYDSSGKGNTNLQSAGDSSVGVVSKNGNDQLPADNLEQNSKGVDDSSIPVQSIGMVISQSNSASTITLGDDKPLMKDIENDNDPSEEDNDSPQNTKKSTLSTIVVSTLVVAAVASIAIFVYLEMLAVGIAVGACCLVVAAVIYCCTPKSQVENSEVEKPFNTREVPTAVPV